MAVMTSRDGVPKARPHSLTRGPRLVAAVLAFASELIHLWVLPDEFAMAPLRGMFFLVVAMAQGALAVNLLLGPGRWTLRLGLVLNLWIVATWAFTRAVGLPMWISFYRLPVGVLDLVATALEVALIVVLLTLRRQARAARANPVP